mmetsp:Transcript_4283/g.10366  ORF Transcript_4283/g.10366 Transcript_4283/m.10366 type:complete len:320 (+) Transcript_4283:681-1640(+)
MPFQLLRSGRASTKTPFPSTQSCVFSFSGISKLLRAANTARRLRTVAPGINITLFAEKRLVVRWLQENNLGNGSNVSAPFSSALFFENIRVPRLLHKLPRGNETTSDNEQDLLSWRRRRSYQHKIAAMQLSPYDRTLYMDPDTGVCGPKRRIDELFAALDEYDLAVSAEKPKAASSSPAMNVYSSSIPRKFLERYWRVVLYRRTEPMLELLDKIMEIFTAASNLGLGHTSDQQAVREALYLSKGRTMEKRLNDSRELCRLPLKKHKGGCGKLEPLCKASKCVLLQDRCERRPDATKGRPAAKGRPGTKAAPAKAPAQGR